MGEQHGERPDDDEQERSDGAEAADTPYEVEEPSPAQPDKWRPSTRPLCDPAVSRITAALPPLIDRAVFLRGINPLADQFAEIAARAVAPLSQSLNQHVADIATQALAPLSESLNQHVAESIARAWSKIDLTPLLPTVDVARFRFLPKIDLSGSLPAFRELLEYLRRHEPPNWPLGIDFVRIVEIIRDDGLPLVWVPRVELVQDVIDADDREARVAVLLAHTPELLQDCRDVLDTVTHDVLAGQQQLAVRCVEALEGGHHEAAQALAVAVTETAVSRILGGNYAKVKQQVLFDVDLVPYTQLRLRAALAPIHRFYTEWNPRSPHPAPEAISRHVSVHRADPSHYTGANSVVAVLLACSVLRALQELQQLAEASGPDQEIT